MQVKFQNDSDDLVLELVRHDKTGSDECSRICRHGASSQITLLEPCRDHLVRETPTMPSHFLASSMEQSFSGPLERRRSIKKLTGNPCLMHSGLKHCPPRPQISQPGTLFWVQQCTGQCTRLSARPPGVTPTRLSESVSPRYRKKVHLCLCLMHCSQISQGHFFWAQCTAQRRYTVVCPASRCYSHAAHWGATDCV